jgi:predicted neutral ceramidase superfamily lipid hydrolase
MAKPNYSFEKRQRELAKKKKKEEKLQERAARKSTPAGPAEAGMEAADSVLPDEAGVAEVGQAAPGGKVAG